MATATKKLQFGHGCGAVEMTLLQSSCQPLTPLQFGHGCGAVEMPSGGCHRAAAEQCFNSATAAEPWRCIDQRNPNLGWKRLQFGHGCGAVEMLPNPNTLHIRVHCFNSATAAEPWRSRYTSSNGRE